MGIIYHRPVNGVDYGDGSPVVGGGSGYPLGDAVDASFKRYMSTSESGTILVYPEFTGTVPVGREILAVAAGHRERQQWYLLGSDNGWVMTYLRVGGKRQQQARAYKQDGSGGWRTKLSPPLYKKNFEPWTKAEINTMSTDTGIATGEFGPVRSKMWCQAAESFIAVIYTEPLVTPSAVTPGGTVDTVSLALGANIRAPQAEQPVRPMWQLARDSAFTQDVREFYGPYTTSTVDIPVIRTSDPMGDSHTDLEPGTWHIRVRTQDVRGGANVSAWRTGSPINIVLPAPPQAVAVQDSSLVNTPYSIRRGRVGFTGAAPGGRAIGIEWQFSATSNFASVTASWKNLEDAILWSVASPGAGSSGSEVFYDPTPDPSVRGGLHGRKVSPADPSQYLSQVPGQWYMRVRGIDRFGGAGPWSAAVTFTVSHPPVVLSQSPDHGGSIDATTGVMSWTMGDPWPGDTQSGATVKLYHPDTPGLELLEHEVFGSASTVTPGTLVDLTPHMRKVIPYFLILEDRDGVEGWGNQGTMRISRNPDVTVHTPVEGENLPTGAPMISWSSVFAATGVSQRSVSIVIRRMDNGAIAHEEEVAFPGAISAEYRGKPLDNLTEYMATVSVTDTEGLTGSKVVHFSTAFIRPIPVHSYPDATSYTELGYVRVTIDPADRDAEFSRWVIHRRRALPGEQWEEAGHCADPYATEWLDWGAAGTGHWEYAVTQEVMRYGSPVQSLIEHIGPQVYLFSDSYWLIVPGDERSSVRLHHVSGDEYTSEREMSEYVIIGGGRRVARGTVKGKSGALSATVRHSTGRSATAQLKALEDLNADGRAVIMRDPFGNRTLVQLGEISVSRVAGVGSSEFADLGIPYSEVME